MFRRKTDQVYATLQQVQRRITEQGGSDLANEIPLVREAPPTSSYPLSPQPSSAPRPATIVGAPKAPGLGGASVLSGPAPQATPAGGPPRTPLLTLSNELASFLVILWLITLVIAFVVGRSQAPRQQVDPGADYAAGPAGHRDPGAAKAAKPAAAAGERAVLVVMSAKVGTYTAAHEAQYEAQAREMNRRAIAAGDPYKPWFAVRKPANGDLQMVWGYVDGAFGVDREAHDAFRESLVKIEDGGKKPYAGVFWLPVD
ncbi:MAG TPA: hypothetical protein VEL07_23670 [Planctomycetota bacterium]|nr:hypothetical protein [Planctomycetota bacterium]